ncbi:MAG: aminopeptidase, partial [SAR324 cluster bacterium]|nr:aminopeptidase [SAR324 cluster bacterium]
MPKSRKKSNVKKTLKQLEETLLFKKKSAWEGVKKRQQKEISDLAEDYKLFLDGSKTERESIQNISRLAGEHGFVHIANAGKTDRKLLLTYDNVAGALVVVNNLKTLDKGFLMNGAHIDVPRLDLKQYPLYEAEDMAYMKTHYYGGIKKYQWVTRPLALHGVVVLENGKTVTITIGEDPQDPVFTINDILPHLAQNQNKKTAPKVIEGEQLNILVGSI